MASFGHQDRACPCLLERDEPSCFANRTRSRPPHPSSRTAARSCAARATGSVWSPWRACSMARGCSRRRQARPARSPRREGHSTRWPRSRPHFPGKAKSVIWLFMNGGQSQVDTWDPKPELAKTRRQGPGRLRRHDRLLQGPGRAADEVAVPVRATRRVRGVGLGDLPGDRPACRRPGVPPRLLHETNNHSPGPVPDQHRHEPDGLPLRRVVGHVRPGHREPEPARRSS